MDSRELKDALAALVREALPEIAGALWPVRGRIVAVHEAGGDEADESPRYTVDVQVLCPDGSDDTTWPEIPKVDLPQLWAGPDVGVWCTPDVGMLVRIGWEYGDRSRPYVDTLLGIGGQAPEHPAGDLVVKAGGATVRIGRGNAGAGELVSEAATVTITGRTKVVIASDVVVELGAEGGGALVRHAELLAALNGLVLPLHLETAVAGPVAVPLLNVGATTKVKAT